MAITVATLLDRSVRMLGELQSGQSLDAGTLSMLGDHAMEWVNGLAAHVTGTGDTLYDKSVDEDVTLSAGNVRLRCTVTCEVTLPADPQDGWRIVVSYVKSGQTLTLDPNGHKANGSTGDATVAAGAVDDFFFRAEIGDWVDPRVTATSDNVPYPDDCLRGLAAMLAIEVQPLLGLPLKFDTRAQAGAGEAFMVKRYFRKHPSLFTGWRYQAAPPAPRATP